MDDLCTPDDIKRIRAAAQERLNYLLWLASKLEITSDELIRREAAKEIRQLLEAKRD